MTHRVIFTVSDFIYCKDAPAGRLGFDFVGQFPELVWDDPETLLHLEGVTTVLVEACFGSYGILCDVFTKEYFNSI